MYFDVAPNAVNIQLTRNLLSSLSQSSYSGVPQLMSMQDTGQFAARVASTRALDFHCHACSKFQPTTLLNHAPPLAFMRVSLCLKSCTIKPSLFSLPTLDCTTLLSTLAITGIRQHESSRTVIWAVKQRGQICMMSLLGLVSEGRVSRLLEINEDSLIIRIVCFSQLLQGLVAALRMYYHKLAFPQTPFQLMVNRLYSLELQANHHLSLFFRAMVWEPSTRMHQLATWKRLSEV